LFVILNVLLSHEHILQLHASNNYDLLRIVLQLVDKRRQDRFLIA